MRDTHAKKGHKAVLVLLALLCAYALVPVLGTGLYRNGSGQVFFDLWYLVGFMVIAFFLMHELITPLPPKEKDETSPGKKSGRMGFGRRPMLAPAESAAGR
jgi:hypothetical protein